MVQHVTDFFICQELTSLLGNYEFQKSLQSVLPNVDRQLFNFQDTLPKEN